MIYDEPLFQPHEVTYMKRHGDPPVDGITKRYYPTVRIKYRNRKIKPLIEPTDLKGKWLVWKYE